MFTGLIEAIGQIVAVRDTADGRTMTIAANLGDPWAEGESVAVNGVCLTVASARDEVFEAQVAPETLRVTTLARSRPGQRVNLERPLKADGRIGGHFVLGHVDAVGTVRRLETQGESYWLEIEVPAELLPLIVSKGSIAIDGISLTVARLEGRTVSVQIVPHTWAHTILPDTRVGDGVNIEADVIGKYVQRRLQL
jgi:riboflavin synthase